MEVAPVTHTAAQNLALKPPPSAPTTATRTRFVPPAETPTKASSARKTVREVPTRPEHSTTPVKLALLENLTVYGISMNANRGPIA